MKDLNGIIRLTLEQASYKYNNGYIDIFTYDWLLGKCLDALKAQADEIFKVVKGWNDDVNNG